MRSLRAQLTCYETFAYYYFLFPLHIVGKARDKWTGKSAIEVNIENETFTIVYSRY